jgi:hypothetical protein
MISKGEEQIFYFDLKLYSRNRLSDLSLSLLLLKIICMYRVIIVSIIALMMEAASTYETSLNACQNIRRNNPEHSRIHGLILTD